MNLYKAETGGVYGPLYVAARSFAEAAQLVYDSNRRILRMEVVTDGQLLIADAIDHGDEALSDVLRERIDTALEYIDEMRECPPKSVRWNLVLADLAVISGILEGKQEADR